MSEDSDSSSVCELKQEQDVIILSSEPENSESDLEELEEAPSASESASPAIARDKHPVAACEICESSPSKYTCPGCSVRTCSVKCVQEHKVKLNCTGERDKTAFVDMKDYSDIHLLNDYRFLEDAERRLYSNKLAPQNKRWPVAGAPYHLTRRSKLLITAALKRGVKLKMVSSALTKNKINSSFYTIRSDTIDWHIEWHFIATNTIIHDTRVPEITRLVEAARKHTNFVEFPHLRKSLEDYKKDRLDKSRFLLKVDGLPANRERYFELKPTACIAENLKGHCLTEFPVIKVLPPSFSDAEYTLLSKDDVMVMDKISASHLSVYHPELNLRTAIEETLLNPKSSVYSATQNSTDSSVICI